MPYISDTVIIGGIPTNGAIINAYKASRFAGIPALNAAAPAGGADAGPVTSGTAFGGVGEFQITVPTLENYYCSAAYGGNTAWQFYPLQEAAALTAADGTIVIGGTAAAPTVRAGALPESAVTNLTTDLASKAADSTVVHVTGNETVTGAKTTTALLTASGGITGLPAPVNPSDAGTKSYVDATTQGGLNVKASCLAIATANVALTGAQTVDGVALVAGNRVLLNGQTTASQNGPWVVQTGAWTRPTDFASGSVQPPGDFVFVGGGTVNASSGWVMQGTTSVTVDTTANAWTQFSGLGEVSATAPLSKSGNVLSLSEANILHTAASGVSPQGLDTSATAQTKAGSLTVQAGLTVNGTAIDASSAGGTTAAAGLGIGDKIALFQGLYGFGIQPNRLVAYVSTGTAFAVRAASGAGNASSGADSVILGGDGTISAAVAGKGLQVKEGANAKQGTAVLAAGAVTVANTSVTATSRILLTSQVDGGTPGFLRVSARTAGTSFVITSSNPLDTSTVAYQIFEPA